MKDKAAIEDKSYLEQRLVAAESFAYMMMMNLHKDLFDDGLKLVYAHWQKLITEAPPSPVQGIKSKEGWISASGKTDNLLPCPFCGGSPEWVNLAHPSGIPALQCSECQFRMQQDRRDKTIFYWNRRSSSKGEDKVFTLQQGLDIWDESGNYHSMDGFMANSPDKVKYFKEKFGIDI